jgi:hypothetical protein
VITAALNPTSPGLTLIFLGEKLQQYWTSVLLCLFLGLIANRLRFLPFTVVIAVSFAHYQEGVIYAE